MTLSRLCNRVTRLGLSITHNFCELWETAHGADSG